MKKTLSFLLSLVMIMGFITSMPLCVTAASEDDLTFKLNNDGESYSVTECDLSAEGEIVIPATYNGYPVKRIDFYAFSGSDVTSVIMPDTIRSINEGAFYQCDNLTSVTIPDSVVYMGNDVFYDCDNLQSVFIGNGVNQIFEDAFYSCDKLETVVLGNNVSRIGNRAFFDCEALTGITIPASVRLIQDDAFNQCLNLADVTFNNGLEYIGIRAFHRCEALTTLVFPYSVEEIGGDCFFGCKNISSVTIYNEDTMISLMSFGYWENADRTIVSSDTLTVCGKKGSIAERVANKNGFVFVEDNHTHTSSDWIIEAEASCITEGLKIKVCSICGFTCESKTIEKLEHNYLTDWIISQKPTVYGAGFKYKACTECGLIREVAEIAQLKCSKPNIKSAANSGNNVKVTWDKVTGADGYYVYRKASGGARYYYLGNTTKTYYVDDSAKAGTVYTYKLRARNEAGYSAYSSEKTVKHIDQPALKTPTNTANGVNISWNKVGGASGYRVYRKTSTGWKYLGRTTKTNYVDKNVKSGTNYTYTVKAYNGDYNSSYSTSGKSIKFLGTPTLKTPSSTKSGVKLNWNKVAGAQGYVVYYKVGSGSYKTLATVKGNAKVSYTHTKAQKGKKYTYKVRAYYSKTYSGYSNAKAITDKY